MYICTYVYVYVCVYVYIFLLIYLKRYPAGLLPTSSYRVASASRIDKIIGLLCKRAL